MKDEEHQVVFSKPPGKLSPPPDRETLLNFTLEAPSPSLSN